MSKRAALFFAVVLTIILAACVFYSTRPVLLRETLPPISLPVLEEA